MDPDIVEMSLKIAEAVAPKEKRLAPRMTQAFTEGGKERKSLFPNKKNNDVGSFGDVGSIYLFPTILLVISNNAGLLNTILDNLTSLGTSLEPISPVKDLIDLYDRINKSKKSSVSSAERERLADELNVDLKIVMETFTGQMVEAGHSEQESESIAYRTLMKLLENPSKSINFVKAVSKTP